MTSAERVLAAINFQTPDRLPVWDKFWPEFTQAWRRHKGLPAAADPRDDYGIDMSVVVADEAYFPSQRAVLGGDENYQHRNDGWGRIVRAPRRDAYFVETLDTILKTPADLDRLAFEPAQLDARFTGFDELVRREKTAGRCVFAKVGGIYVRSHFLRGEDRLLMDMAADEDFCDALFDRVAAHLTGMALETLRRAGCQAAGLFVYDDMANSRAPMFSPAMFERYFLPRYQKLIATCRAAGCRHVFFHSDGNIAPVLDLLLQAGFEGFNPLEPRCGLDLVKLRQKYGNRAVFFGGICNTRILPRGDKNEIEKHVRPLLELGRAGGLILGQASVGPDIAPATYDYYIGLVRQASACPV